jgi:sugar/nucleoside kinase (ribokinase family)
VLHLSENEVGAWASLSMRPRLASFRVPEVVVTLGERGSAVWTGGVLERIPASPVEEADPTGAGDSFMAAYLARGRVGDPPPGAARRATEIVRDLLAGTPA